MNSLTDKQKQFCKEYCIDFNATRSAKASGYSEKTAYSIGSENLRKPEIKAYIEHLQKDLLKLCGVSVLSNVTKLKEIINNEEARDNDKIKALEVINKMLSLNAPDKTETKVEDLRSTEPCSITFTRK
jgi:phage terminase small subunit